MWRRCTCASCTDTKHCCCIVGSVCCVRCLAIILPVTLCILVLRLLFLAGNWKLLIFVVISRLYNMVFCFFLYLMCALSGLKLVYSFKYWIVNIPVFRDKGQINFEFFQAFKMFTLSFYFYDINGVCYGSICMSCVMTWICIFAVIPYSCLYLTPKGSPLFSDTSQWCVQASHLVYTASVIFLRVIFSLNMFPVVFHVGKANIKFGSWEGFLMFLTSFPLHARVAHLVLWLSRFGCVFCFCKKGRLWASVTWVFLYSCRFMWIKINTTISVV
jgi:hypothetical protein